MLNRRPDLGGRRLVKDDLKTYNFAIYSKVADDKLPGKKDHKKITFPIRSPIRMQNHVLIQHYLNLRWCVNMVCALNFAGCVS
tara:strand:- start:352 stop:600 length:249 start_codon:yes stop_codon:yes gene_type:complete